MDFQRSHKNPTGIAVVVALHLLAVFIAVKGSTVLIRHAPPAVIDLVPPADVPPPPPAPPSVPLPDAVPLPTTIAVPEIPIDVPQPQEPAPLATRPASEPAPAAAAPAASGPAAPAQEPARHAPVKVEPVVDAKACRRPDYPRNAQRNGDTGTVTLALLVGTDGRVADSRVEKSSGFRELDAAAKAALSLCRFQPGTVDGVPYQSWTRMAYVWSLDE